MLFNRASNSTTVCDFMCADKLAIMTAKIKSAASRCDENPKKCVIHLRKKLVESVLIVDTRKQHAEAKIKSRGEGHGSKAGAGARLLLH